MFQDAEFLYQEAIKELEAGKIRDAAEKAWGATLRATNALILARIGEEPKHTSITSRRLHELLSQDDEVLEFPENFKTSFSLWENIRLKEVKKNENN